ncbi:GNAT family N-acetyltransferase [Streptomyces sp. NPDC006798]|uniref:GNAT family N-acetyltransferase n=1 Tax=Streptomyces sp. NPDC006798 TaxID=3155462 RepID=UPI0033BFD827
MPITPDALSAAGPEAPAPAEPLSVLHTFQLAPGELAAIRALMDEAFEGDFSDEDLEHGLGGMHAVIHDADGRLIAHGSLIMRRVLHGGRWLRIGYVEALAVRVDRQRQGLGGRVMAALEQIVARAYDFGALSASEEGAGLYRSRGWWPWTGRIEGVSPDGLVRLADEEGTTYVWGGVPAPEDSLAFDWRDGDVL